ncbi:MAG: NAD(P)/FAD-dependent oxidoreductase [Lachnospiraceae bacterium]|nr:NAD(P)/FAD-dependent oxidoreductase [Lachnospiraceae bacterium]
MKVLIVGAGAAGMMASISAAQEGHSVYLFEKNEKPGKKIYITGKGRCNITNDCDVEDLFSNIVTNSKFMYSSIYGFTNKDVIDMFNRLGCKTKVERGQRVFPVSDKSSDVISALQREMKRLKVNIEYNTCVKDVIIKDDVFKAIKVQHNNKFKVVDGDKLIIATGGLSYPSTGSTGDGYEFAKKIGHTIETLSPSLVPFNLKGEEHTLLQGLSLKNIEVSVENNAKILHKDFGEMLFTHFGISGPVILSACPVVLKHIQKFKKKNKEIGDIYINIDLKPALTVEQLDDRLLRDFSKMSNKDFKNSLDELLPKKLIPVIIERSGIDPNKKVSFITKEERKNLVNIIKKLRYTFAGFRGYAEAIITKGGIKVKEINPSTMESKLVKGVYFAGEVIDVDALTGGYNLQVAWSTGYLAGKLY